MANTKIIEHNPMYDLMEIQGKLVKEIMLKINDKGYGLVQLTPYGAAELAKQLLQWATSQDRELASMFPSFCK